MRAFTVVPNGCSTVSRHRCMLVGFASGRERAPGSSPLDPKDVMGSSDQVAS